MIIEARAPQELRTLKDITGRDILDPLGQTYEVDSRGRVRRSRQYFRLPNGRLIPLKIGGGAGSSLIFCDSFGHYSTAQFQRKWTIGNGGTTIIAGRSGNGGINLGGNFYPIYKTFGPSYSTITVGFAYQTSLLDYPTYLLQFGDVYQNIGSFGLNSIGDGRFTIGESYNNVTSPPSTFVMNVDQWYYLECQIAGSQVGVYPTITYTVRINGGVIMNGSLSWTSGLNKSPTIAQMGISPTNEAGTSSQISDLYVTDTEFLGDITIICLYPNADGDASAWTPLVAGANYLMTKEHPADDDTTYIYSATAGNQELEYLDSITGPVSDILGGQFLWLARKSLPGPATIQGAIKSAGVTVNTSTWYPSANNYLYLIQPYRKSPFTTNDFTVAEVNALQTGPTRIS